MIKTEKKKRIWIVVKTEKKLITVETDFLNICRN